MQKYDSLKNIIAIIGENELSPQDRADYQKAKKLINFFSLLTNSTVVVNTGFQQLEFPIGRGVLRVNRDTVTLFADV